MDDNCSLTEGTAALIIRIISAAIHISKVVADVVALRIYCISNSIMCYCIIYRIIYYFPIGFFISRDTEAATAKE